MPTKKIRGKTPVRTNAPWFVPAGQMVGLRSDLLETLRALDGRTPREIFADRGDAKPAADLGIELDDVAGQAEEDLASLVAIVPLTGPVTQYAGVCDWMFGGTSLEWFMDSMEEAFANEAVGSILMIVDSPGGEVAGIADAADRIREISRTKPVLAWVPGDGCSAAYWLASSATKIIVSQTAMLGSIGVVMTYIDDSKADEQAGIREIEFVSSVAPDKRPDPNTKSGKEKIQALVDEFGEIFVGAVAKFRGVTADKVKADFGQGGVKIGASAVEAGLADSIGTLASSIQAAQELAGAAGDSSTGSDDPASSGRADAHGGPMAEKKTADQVKADHPDAAAEIAAAAAQAERERIAGIMKYNTAAYRAVAGDKIDAAIKDGKTTGAQLAEQILDAQNANLTKTRAARNEDNEDLDDAEEPDSPPDEEDEQKAKAKAGRVSIDSASLYARMNGGE